MSWALPSLFIRLIAHVRGANGLARLIPHPTWTLLGVSLVVFFLSVVTGRHPMLFRWPRFQRRGVQ
jgi:hypothetical protein